MARVMTFPTLELPPRIWFPSVASARGSLLCDCGCYHGLIILAVMSTSNCDWYVAVDNIEHSFGSRLVLTSREYAGGGYWFFGCL